MHGNELARLRLCAAIGGIAIGIAGCSGDDEGGDLGGNMFGNANESGSGGSNIVQPGGVDDDDDPTTGCADGLVRTSRVTPRVILVVDGSCSMSTDYPASGQSSTECTDNGGSRWAALRNALVGDNGVVARLDHAIEFGMVVFGTQPNCPLTADPINPALDNFDTINGALRDTPPGMYTPTGPALDYVYQNMIQGAQLDTDGGPEIVVLATDGEPNSCGDANTNYQPSIDAVTASMGMSVTTHVISLANAQGEFHDHLSQLATLGGSQRLYEPGTPEQLAADLELLIGGAVGCDVALNGIISPGMECSGTVSLNGEPLECDRDWELVDSRHIRLLGDACDDLMASASAQLEADFPCGVFDVD